MKELDYQTQQAALSAQLGLSKLQLEMVLVLLVQLEMVQHLHSQHVQPVCKIITVQMLETPVLPATHPVRPQTLLLDRLDVVRTWAYMVPLK